jgi:Na+/H+-dicarboxylate symporter
VAVVQALMKADLPKGSAGRLVSLLLLNTLVAIVIGLLVANLLQPGRFTALPQQDNPAAGLKTDPYEILKSNFPKSLLGPLTDGGNVLAVIILAIAFGIALRKSRHEPVVVLLVDVAFRTLITVLHWVIQIIPFAVLGVVASTVGQRGFSPFVALGMFIVAVLLALALQTTYYLLRIHFASWVRPWEMLKGMRDALVMAFSTASSTATMPLTYACLREKVGLRERSASLGSLIGANFNNDGTALYEAMAALFIAQATGLHLTLPQQLMVVLTSIVASVGAAGIPEAGLVTMTLVLTSVGLDVRYIPFLVTVDWFLDRCRTTVNVLGDVNVSCILDGHARELNALADAPPELSELSGDGMIPGATKGEIQSSPPA